MPNISLPDGSIREFKETVTPLEVAQSISEGLARNTISALVNGKQVEVTTPITEDATVQLLTWNDDLGKKAFWHSSAHLLAQAILAFYPKAKLTIGPAIDSGFYYDVDFGDETLSEKDFEKIEKKMIENAKKNSTFNLYSVSKADALKEYADNPYKTELIQNLNDGEITFCTHDNFTDLCRGGHIPSTGIVKAVKILNAAGAYWRGNENNPQLTRVYGISFPKQKELTEYLERLEEAKRRDHRKLGKELGIFAFSERVGAGLPLWLPKGTALRKKLENFLSAAQKKAGYEFVITPHIGNIELYKTSGHYEKYGADSFQSIKTPHEGEEFLLKPMNCPHHCEIYKTSQWSYKDLPKRYAEFGTVYRYEQSGELHGLTRVRGFTQDDAHLFCTPDQLLEEFEGVIDLVLYVFSSLGFADFTAQISLRDKENRDKYIGSEENWEKAESAIITAAANKGLKTVVEYGEAAFYGPKLDFMIKDAIGRRWQLGTIQVDYNLPQRFKLEYTDEDNQKKTPVMIHRAPFGSLERFTAVLIEHTAGHFPLWLTPDQVAILPISEKYNDYAREVARFFDNNGVRATIDDRNEKIGRKIRDNELKRVPYMVIVGEKESAEGLVSMRKQGGGEQATMTQQEFVDRVNGEVAEMLEATNIHPQD